MTATTADFFAFARERYGIFLKRKAGEPKPWTKDEVLRQFKFCNVFREDDATTVWIRDNIREPLRDDPKVFQAMLLSRWFNRISTLEVLKDLILADNWSTEEARSRLEKVSPIFTAAYLIRSPKGTDKLSGVLWSIEQVLPQVRALAAKWKDQKQWTLEQTTEWLAGFEGLGHFMSYEVVTDLRHTFMLENAPDIMTWANPGPGCEEGIRDMLDGAPAGGRAAMIDFIRDLLEQSKDPENWPEEWPAWEAREVEHTLCDFHKYWKTKQGDGTPKQLFDGGGPRTISYGQGRVSTTRRPPVDPTEAFIRKKMENELNALEQKRIDLTELVVKAAETLVKNEKVDPAWLPSIEIIVVLAPNGTEHEFNVSPPRRLPAFLEESGAAYDSLMGPAQKGQFDDYLLSAANVAAKEARLREALAALDA